MGMLAIIAGMTSCLKDKGFEDQDYGVDISGSPTASARSVTLKEGILGTKISPPKLLMKDHKTISTPCFKLILNLVISL